jgi:hypothetical protein
MTVQQIASRLANIGATTRESELLSEIMHLNGWHLIPAHKVSEKVRSDMETWLSDFRAEQAEQHAITHAMIEARMAAGYRTLPCERCGMAA